MTITQSVQKNLQTELSLREITVTTLSRMSGVPQPTLWRYANGVGTPTINNLVKIANSLDVDVSDLIK